jgi:hypothetical protein
MGKIYGSGTASLIVQYFNYATTGECKDEVIIPSHPPFQPLPLRTRVGSENIPRNRLGTVSVVPRKKVLIPRHSEFRGRASSEARNGIPRKNEVLRNSLNTEQNDFFGFFF